jgi:prophage regulatory protein
MLNADVANQEVKIEASGSGSCHYRRRSASIGVAMSHPPASETAECRPIRREQLRKLVPLADTTIYEMEQRGEFPRRFYLTARCAVWDLGEVQKWLQARRADKSARVVCPDVGRRLTRPVKAK